MALDVVGIKTVIEGLQPYIAGISKINVVNNTLNVNFKKIADSSTKAAAAQAFFQKSLKVGNIEAISASSRGMSVAFANASSAGAKLSNTVVRSQASTTLLGRGLGALSVATNGFSNVTKAAVNAQTAFGKALIAVTGFGNRAAVAFKFGALALGTFAAAFTISTASAFETQLAKIDNLTETTTEETNQLGEAIKNLSRTVPKSPSELGAAAYQILSSGIGDTRQAFDILQISSKAATAGLGSTEDVAKTVTAVIKAYGEENITAAQATDILFAGVRAGRGEAADFARELGTVVGIARNVGVEFDQVTAFIAAFTNVGLTASEATTAFRGILNQLISPGKQAEDTLKTLGTSVEALQDSVAEKGLLQAFLDLATASDNNINVITRLLPEVRGLNGALIALRDGGKETARILETIRNSSGITDEAFQNMSKTFGFQAGLLKNQLNIILLNLGSQILPALTTEIGKLIAFLERNRESIARLAQDMIRFASEVIQDFVRGITAINSALKFIPDNVGVIIAGVAAIGAAMVIAFGPGSAAFLAVFGIVTLLGLISKETAKADLPKRTQELQDVAEQLRLLGGQVPESPFLQFEPRQPSAFEQAAAKRGLSDAERNRRIDELTKKFEELNTSITRLEEAEGKGILGAAGNKTLTEAQAEQAKVAKELSDIYLRELTPQMNNNALAADAAAAAEKALSDGIIDFAEATELGIDAITAGALEASVVFDDAAEKAFNFTKVLSKVANLFNQNVIAANKLVLSLQREALAKIQAAQSALFGRPTKEVAALELNLAQLELKRAEVAASVIPQIEALQDQLDALNEINQPKDLGEASTQTVAAVIQQGLQGGMGALNAVSKEVAGSLEEQKKAIQNQINALQRQLELEDRGIDTVQRQIAIFQAQTDILQKQIQLADATLETQESQRKKAEELAAEMATASSQVAAFANAVGEDVLEPINEMREAINLAAAAAQTISDKFNNVLNPALDTAATNVGTLAGSTKKAADIIDAAMSIVNDTIQGLGQPSVPPVTATHQHGGLITRPVISMLGEGSRPELVLPLTEPRRSRELLGSLPPGILGQILGNRSNGPSSIFGGDVNVQGHTLEDMEAATIQTIRRMFEQQRRGFHRQGLR